MEAPGQEQKSPLSSFVPPQDQDAERSVLGCMLVDEAARAEVFNYLTRDSFVQPAHRVIFHTIREMYEARKAVDIITVNAALESDQAYISAGGAAYLAGLAEMVPTTENAVDHAKIVRDKAQLRQLIDACRDAIRACGEGGREAKDIIGEAEKNIVMLLKDNARGLQPVSKLIMPSIDNLAKLAENRKQGSKVSGVDTGFREINNMTSGFHGGELIIIAARPSMGKTALALNMAEHVAELNNAAVAFFSMEMGPDELVRRLLSSRAGVKGQNMRRGDLAEMDYAKLVRAGGVLKKLELFIDSSPSLT